MVQVAAASFAAGPTFIINIAFVASFARYTLQDQGSFTDLVDTFIAVEYQAAICSIQESMAQFIAVSLVKAAITESSSFLFIECYK